MAPPEKATVKHTHHRKHRQTTCERWNQEAGVPVAAALVPVRSVASRLTPEEDAIGDPDDDDDIDDTLPADLWFRSAGRRAPGRLAVHRILSR